jgi:hypothetical protein
LIKEAARRFASEQNMNQKILLIEDRGWEVAVSSWTVAAKPGKKVNICYLWTGESGGVLRELNLTMDQFLETVRAAEGPIVDLRHVSR